MRSWLVLILGIIISAALVFVFKSSLQTPATAPSPSASPIAPITMTTGNPSAATTTTPASTHTAGAVDLTPDSTGLSKATVVMNTSQGVIKFKFYTNDAPVTVHRFAELAQNKFYDGLIFHRVVPGFVIQGGDPTGTGAGGSGRNLKAEFNSRHHVEGTVAMARAADVDSADSQFYISLGVHPHLDQKYTIFGQVIEGLDVAKKIKPGDKMTTVTIQ